MRARSLWLLLLCGLCLAQQPGELFDSTIDCIEDSFFDRTFRRETLPGLAARYRERARKASDFDAERAVIQEMLAEIPFSHVALCESYAYETTHAFLTGDAAPSTGVELTELEGSFYVRSLLPGGPGSEAGLRRGDRVVAIDGQPTAESPRFQWRIDDPWLPDTPLHMVRCSRGETVRFEVERDGVGQEIPVRVRLVSLAEATAASARVIERAGRRFGYVHLEYIYDGADSRLARAIRGELRNCEGLILDLRGRGGIERTANRIVSYFSGRRPLWHGPLILLIDVNTRSAKEMIAHRLQSSGRAETVGHNTTGAVLYSQTFSIGQEMYLMLPVGVVPRYSSVLEGVGVAADVAVLDDLPRAEGGDPILEAGIERLQEILGGWVD